MRPRWTSEWTICPSLNQSTLWGGSGLPVALHMSWIGLLCSMYSLPDTCTAVQIHNDTNSTIGIQHNIIFTKRTGALTTKAGLKIRLALRTRERRGTTGKTAAKGAAVRGAEGVEIETLKASRADRDGKGCPLPVSIRYFTKICFRPRPGSAPVFAWGGYDDPPNLLVGWGVPLPSRLGGLGDRRNFPQWSPGQSPVRGRKQILVKFELERCIRAYWLIRPCWQQLATVCSPAESSTSQNHKLFFADMQHSRGRTIHPTDR